MCTLQDHRIRIDFGQLAKFVQGTTGWPVNRQIVALTLFGYQPPPADPVWQLAAEQGWKLIAFECKGAENMVDCQMLTEIAELVCSETTAGVIAVVSGDRNFLPSVHLSLKQGWQSEVYRFKGSTSSAYSMYQRDSPGFSLNILSSEDLTKITYKEYQYTRTTRFGDTLQMRCTFKNSLTEDEKECFLKNDFERECKWPFQYYWSFNDSEEDPILVFRSHEFQLENFLDFCSSNFKEIATEVIG